jgi:hypothetical protein
MHRGNPCQTRITGVERARDRRKAGHEALGVALTPIGTLQQPLDLSAFAYDKTFIPPLNQRRCSEQKPIISTGEADIVRACLAKPPNLVGHRLVPLIGTKIAISDTSPPK